MGDRREGTASWVEPSESRSDLQPGGRCCRRERQRPPTPPGAASLFYCSWKKRCRLRLALPFLRARKLCLHYTAPPGPPAPPQHPNYPYSRYPHRYFSLAVWGAFRVGADMSYQGKKSIPHITVSAARRCTSAFVSGQGTALSGRAESAGGGGERGSGVAVCGATASFHSSALGSFSFHSFDFVTIPHPSGLMAGDFAINFSPYLAL